MQQRKRLTKINARPNNWVGCADCERWRTGEYTREGRGPAVAVFGGGGGGGRHDKSIGTAEI